MENKKGNLPWFMTDTVGIEFGPTGAAVDDEHYMERMTGANIVEKAVKANAEYLILFCKDSGYAYYKSKYRPLPPGLGGRDLLREVCDAAAGKNMHIIAYSCVQYDATALREHPEWNQLDDRGRKLNHLCLRNPEYTEYMKGVIDELAMYTIDGFHIDMLNLGFGEPCGCWCENCKTAFKDEYGYEMPAKFDLNDPAFRDAFEFRYSNNNKMCSELEAHVKRNYPRLSIDFNYHGSPPFSYESGQRPVQHAAFGDFLTAESLPWIFGYNNIAMITRFLCAANRDKPYQVVSSRSIYNYHEYTLRPTEDMRYEVMCIIANGGTFTMVDKAGYDGWFDNNVYTRLSSVFAEARRKAGIARGHKRAQVGCAIYFSQKTRDFVYREKMYDYHNSIAGLCRMLS